MSEPVLPVEALQPLVDKVVGKFTQGDIGLDEAASRLVGTGRFEENSDALDFLRQEVCPKLEERLHSIEEEIAGLQAEADRVRAVLGIGATNVAPPAPAQPYVPTGKGKKEKAAPEKKRKGAERAESIWDAHAEAAASAGSDALGARHLAKDVAGEAEAGATAAAPSDGEAGVSASESGNAHAAFSHDQGNTASDSRESRAHPFDDADAEPDQAAEGSAEVAEAATRS